jgi:hypothetical protein
MRCGLGLLVLLVSALTACLPDNTSSNCANSQDCPSGFVCTTDRHVCVAGRDSGPVDASRDAHLNEAGRDAVVVDRGQADAGHDGGHDAASDADRPVDAAGLPDVHLSDSRGADSATPADTGVSHDAVVRDGYVAHDGNGLVDTSAQADRPAAADGNPGLDNGSRPDANGAADASCSAQCGSHPAGSSYCSSNHYSVLACAIDTSLCAVESVSTTCAIPSTCSESPGIAWCDPGIVSFDVVGDFWIATAGTYISVALSTVYADTCSWGGLLVGCNDTTWLVAAACPVCESRELRACRGATCAIKYTHVDCVSGAECICTFDGTQSCS